MTTKKALRRIEKWCREEEKRSGAMSTWGDKPMDGADGELRGMVIACREVRALCRALHGSEGAMNEWSRQRRTRNDNENLGN
jgi:hypothetical protein